MRRAKAMEGGRQPNPGGAWLAGAMIGAAIMAMATGAMVLGASLAAKDAGVKGG